MARGKFVQVLLGVILVLVVGLAAGCGDKNETRGEEGDDDQNQNREPVTLVVFNQLNVSDPIFEEILVQPVREKFPHITIEKVNSAAGTFMRELVASGTVPDLIWTGFWNLPESLELGVVANLTEHVRSEQVDMGLFSQELLDTMKSFHPEVEYFALPFYMNIPVLFYNRAIFDDTGVAYPEHGMSWDDAIQLGQRLNRTMNEVRYYGFYPGNATFMINQLSPQKVDPQTFAARMTTPEFTTVFEALQKGFRTLGQDRYYTYAEAINLFREGRLGMLPQWLELSGSFEEMHRAGNVLDWDMVQQPTFNGTNSQPDSHFFVVSSTSRKQKEAFEVMAYLSTDLSVQETVSRSGRIPAVQAQSLFEVFGADMQSMQGRDRSVLTVNKPAVPQPFIKYDRVVDTQANSALTRMVNENIDYNTILRAAEETANQQIRQQLAQ